MFLGHPKKIAVFRALQLGDLLCSIPVFRSLRLVYPDAHITLIGLPWTQKFTQRFSKYINALIPFPGFPGLPEQQYNTDNIVGFIHDMRRKKFDLLLQMHGNGSIINPLMQLLGANKVAGFYPREDYCPNQDFFLEYPEHLSETERLIALLRFLKVPVHSADLEFPITKNEQNNLLLHPLFQKLKKRRYICIHPGARDPKRRWNPFYFAHLADMLAVKNFSIVLTGIKEELPLVREVASYMKHIPIIFAGQSSIGETAELLKHAKLIISNCTSIVHIADALHMPSVTIYLTSDAKRWGPQNLSLHKRIDGQNEASLKRALQASLTTLRYYQQVF